MKVIRALLTCAALVIAALAAAIPAAAIPAAAASAGSADVAPVTVVPSAGLAGGDIVHVTAGGITPAAAVQVIQCDIYAGDPEQDCFPRTTTTAGQGGSVSVDVTLVDPAYRAQPFGDPTPVYCRADICRVFLAWLDQDGNQQVLASGPLEFSGSPATTSANRSSNLRRHQLLHVSGTAYGAEGHLVRILEEACFSIIQGSGCYGQNPAVSTTVRTEGTYAVRYRVRRFLSDGTDCADTANILGFCELSVIAYDRNGVPDDSFGVSVRGQPALALYFRTGK